MRTTRYNLLLALALSCLLPGGRTSAETHAAPAHTRAQEVVGETVADRPQPHYRFETHRLKSADGQRRYRVQVGFPTASAGARAGNGYRSVLYMLDGNAAIDTLTQADLEAMSHGNAPVLVAIGYDVPTRNDVVSRAYDYTPPVYENGKRIDAPVVRGRAGGGADAFLQLIEEQIKPLIRARAGNGAREYLWGHSYGGLFAMHVLLSRPDAFDGYIVGDPSIWWHNGELLREWEAFDAARAEDKRVEIYVSAKPRPADRPPSPDAGMIERNGRQIAPRAALQEIAQSLKANGARVSYRAFPQYGHGEMIRVSLERALRMASEQ